jgi:chemotaxis family two-component system response regulator Rcp1
MREQLAPIDILLVEDSPNDVLITETALKEGNIRNKLIVARDGQEALDILFGQEGDGYLPELILLDLNLPKVDGMEVLQTIKSDPRLRLLPVIVLTTSTAEEDIVRSYELGVNTFISKPVQFEDFIKVVATIREYWIVIASLPKVRSA